MNLTQYYFIPKAIDERSVNSYKTNTEYIASHLKKIKPNGTRLLDIGCGTGNFSLE